MDYFKDLTARVDRALEDWGYTLMGGLILVGLPVFFYSKSLSGPRLADIRIVSGVLEEPPELYAGGEDASPSLELVIDASAVPVRFYEPLVDPSYPKAPLDAAAFIAAKPRQVKIGIDRHDLELLEKPPAYAPARWVNGHSLEADGKVYLTVEEGVRAQRREARGFRALAIGFAVIPPGLILCFLAPMLDDKLAALLGRGGGTPDPAPPVDFKSARRAATFYNAFIPGLFCLNLPALMAPGPIAWSFDGRYWLVFAAGVAALQALFFLHHRRFLSIASSQPRLGSEGPAGFMSYLTVTTVLCLMITPFFQVVRGWIFRS